MDTIRVAVCDDLLQICEYIEYICGKYPEFTLSFAAATTAECLCKLKEQRIDVLLLDIQVETPTAGIDIIPEVLRVQPECKIIMLTSYMDDEYIFRAFADGATDYVSKTEDTDHIVQKIRDVWSNTSFLKPEIAQQLAKKSQEIQQTQISLLYYVNIVSKLTFSELEVLKAIYYGNSYGKIAKQRYVTIGTIKALSSRILKKFEAASMKELIKQLEKVQMFELLNL